tara:strand:- start:261 stop:866 length:606 start_codon:yes stop_codon:yes gene_type:complete
MKLLTSPLVVILLAVFSGAGTGLWWYWQAANVLIADQKTKHAEAIEAKRPPEPWDFWTVELESLSRELTEKREALAARESELDHREQLLADERTEVEATRLQIETMRTQISSQILSVQQQEAKNLKTLAQTYSLLTPAAAIAIFEGLDDVMVTKLLSMMKPESVSAIFQELTSGSKASPERIKRAADLSQRLRLIVPANPT